MRTISAILLSLVAIAAAFAQEPAAFKGVPFGTSCASFFQQYKPGGSWAESKLKATIYFSEKDQAIIAETPASYGILMGKAYREQMKDSVAGVEAETRFLFAVQSSDDAKKLKAGIDRSTADKALFQEVQANFESRDFDQVLASLIEKYGQPTRTDKRSVMNKSTGVQSDVPVHVWEISGALVEFAKIAPPRGNPLLTIRSTIVKSMAAKAGADDI